MSHVHLSDATGTCHRHTYATDATCHRHTYATDVTATCNRCKIRLESWSCLIILCCILLRALGPRVKGAERGRPATQRQRVAAPASGFRLKGLGSRVQREGDLQLRDSALQLLLRAARRLYSRRSKTQLFNLSLLLVELLPRIASPVAIAATSCC
jgi:hypothetical protein